MTIKTQNPGIYQTLVVQLDNASLRVSQLLGHERPDVTQGCLASIKDGADGE